MRLHILILTIFFILFSGLHSFAQEKKVARPKIGLVLSGGGAKGLAHIGVLKVLEEAGIVPDYIAGTSMGGIVGGLYSIGYSTDSLEKIARTTHWSYYLSDDIPRREITLEEKEDHDRFVLSVPFTEKSIKIPGGVINGQNIENLLNQLCSPVFEERDFNNFKIPFLCNATDIETGKEVVFREGYLPNCLRATMAIPSVFNPIEIQGKLLVDGGLVNNFPVDRIKEMGADIIIGVDVGFQYYNKSQLNSMFRIIEQSLFFYGEQNTSRNRKLCNILITPSLSRYNAASFNASDSLIILGEQAARAVFPQLKALADSIKSIDRDYGKTAVTTFPDSIMINQIRIEGLKKVSAELVIGKLQLQVLNKYTSAEIGDAVDRLYSSLYFEKVSYELEKNLDGVKLNLTVRESADGTIRFGLHYDSENKSAILLNTTFRNLIFPGSKFAVNAALGDNPYFNTEFFKNNGWKPGFGVSFQSRRSPAFLYKNDRKISSLNFYETKLNLYTESIFQNSFAIGGGVEFENSLIRPVIDPGDIIKDSRYKLINYYVFLQEDSYDDPFYPTKGIKLYSGVKLVTMKNFSPVTFIHARLSKAQSLSKRVTLIGHLNAGVVDGDSIPSQYLFFSGGTLETNRNGIMPFAGLEYMEIASKNLISMKLDAQMRFYNKIFLTGTVNAGNFTNYFSNLLTTGNIQYGYGLSLGYNSLIGPLEISISKSGNRDGIEGFVRIGYWF